MHKMTKWPKKFFVYAHLLLALCSRRSFRGMWSEANLTKCLMPKKG